MRFSPLFLFAFLSFLQAHVSEARRKQTPKESRIIGGRPAKLGQYPYQLQLRLLEYGHLCGATLVISPSSQMQIAVTAAHCVFYPNGTTIPSERLRVRGGTIGVNQPGPLLKIEKIIAHPNYQTLNVTNGIKNDIAILKLQGSFPLTRRIQPMTLPKQGQSLTGSVIVSGWGLLNSSSKDPSSKLRAVELPVVPSQTCNEWYSHGNGRELIHDINFCAGFENGNKVSCSGDSGGPAIGKENGAKYLAGLVSWGNQHCDAPKSPGVFTRISSYVDWIGNVSV